MGNVIPPAKMQCPPYHQIQITICLQVSAQRHSTDRRIYNHEPWGGPSVQSIMEKPHQLCHKEGKQHAWFPSAWPKIS